MVFRDLWPCSLDFGNFDTVIKYNNCHTCTSLKCGCDDRLSIQPQAAKYDAASHSAWHRPTFMNAILHTILTEYTSADMDSIYDSVPLEHGASTNIRVIEILDGTQPMESSAGALVSCKFHTISLEKPPVYTALSYTWGSPDVTKTIELDGTPFEVRENLWDFLRQAQCNRSSRSRYLWIDALCINQSRVTERNHQVGMMGEIYSKAANVAVWLGSKNPEVELGTLKKAFIFEDGHSPYIEKIFLDRGVAALEELSARDYWTRLWVLQEYVLAAQVDIWCGKQVFSDEVLRRLLNDDAIHYSPHIQDSPAMKIIQCRHARRFSSSRMSMKELLDEFGRSMECADIRDRVYALLSLLDENERRALKIEPDYSKSPIELFAHLVSIFGRTATAGELAHKSFTLYQVLKLHGEAEEVQEIIHSAGTASENYSVCEYFNAALSRRKLRFVTKIRDIGKAKTRIRCSLCHDRLLEYMQMRSKFEPTCGEF